QHPRKLLGNPLRQRLRCHRLRRRAPWRAKDHTTTSRARRNRRIRPRQPPRHARREPQVLSEARHNRRRHPPFQREGASSGHERSRRRNTAAGRPAQPRRDRRGGDEVDPAQGVGLLLLRRRRPAHQDTQQHRVPLDPVAPARLHRLQPLRHLHHLPWQQSQHAPVRLARRHGAPRPPGRRARHRAGVRHLRRLSDHLQQRIHDARADCRGRAAGPGLRLAAVRADGAQEERGPAGAHRQAAGDQVHRADARRAGAGEARARRAQAERRRQPARALGGPVRQRVHDVTRPAQRRRRQGHLLRHRAGPDLENHAPLAGQAHHPAHRAQGPADPRRRLPRLPPHAAGPGHHPVQPRRPRHGHGPAGRAHPAGDPQVLPRGLRPAGSVGRRRRQAWHRRRQGAVPGRYSGRRGARGAVGIGRGRQGGRRAGAGDPEGGDGDGDEAARGREGGAAGAAA
ncbi:hypothetical protein LTR04_003350, partial [Oleoguttula sp. CCFEE 6159]